MKSVPKLIRRFVGIMIFCFIVLVFLNVAVLVIIASRQTPNAYPWKTAAEASAALEKKEEGYVLTEEMAEKLEKDGVWAFFVENPTMQVVWRTGHVPDAVPKQYTLSGIVNLTRGYIDGYPAFTGEADNGIMVLGYPKDSFWKHMWPSWDYQFIASAPETFLKVLGINMVFILLVYVAANTKFLNSVKPIVKGIQELPAGEPVYIREKGLLSELAASINSTSEVLQRQKYQLRRKETARANWIAGVSHDIRTPLSMVMGYAGQLESAPGLSSEERKKAAVILRQSARMRNLINDLNLASKLEYNMQPLTQKKENAVAIVRQVAADFINMEIDDKYHIEWTTEEALSSCIVHADKDLLKRAVSNLIQNSIGHNEDGCRIYVYVQKIGQNCVICVEDNGTGVSGEEIEKLNNTPHYMLCDQNTAKQRHGLGLLIVKQIAVSHGGSAEMAHSPKGGLSVKIILPIREED